MLSGMLPVRLQGISKYVSYLEIPSEVMASWILDISRQLYNMYRDTETQPHQAACCVHPGINQQAQLLYVGGR